MAANTRDITTSDFAEAVIARSHQVPVLVDFWAEWCGPCKVLSPTLERLAAEGAGTWELAKVDVDANPELAMQFGVQGIPTVVGFRDGKPVSRFTGALPEQQVRAFLSQLLPSELDLLASEAESARERGDDIEAERMFRQVLDQDPGHEGAGVGLAGLLLERNEPDAALEVLERLAPTEPVRQLQAAARLGQTGDLEELWEAANSGDAGAKVAYGKALAGASRHGEALAVLLEVVESRDEEHSDEARKVMLDLFEVLKPEHPLTAEYRRKLANALF